MSWGGGRLWNVPPWDLDHRIIFYPLNSEKPPSSQSSQFPSPCYVVCVIDFDLSSEQLLLNASSNANAKHLIIQGSLYCMCHTSQNWVKYYLFGWELNQWAGNIHSTGQDHMGRTRWAWVRRLWVWRYSVPSHHVLLGRSCPTGLLFSASYI